MWRNLCVYRPDNVMSGPSKYLYIKICIYTRIVSFLLVLEGMIYVYMSVLRYTHIYIYNIYFFRL